MSQACSSVKYNYSEAEEISATIYQEVTSDLETKVASVELTTSIQEVQMTATVEEMKDD